MRFASEHECERYLAPLRSHRIQHGTIFGRGYKRQPLQNEGFRYSKICIGIGRCDRGARKDYTRSANPGRVGAGRNA